MMGNLLCTIRYYVQWNNCVCVCVMFSETLQKHVIMPAKYSEAKAGYNQCVYYDLV